MNECDRELKDVAVKLAIPNGTFTATLWQDNVRQPDKVAITDGNLKATLSPKGITAFAIQGVDLAASFQQKFTAEAAPESSVTHRRIATPAGDAEVMILSFGPELTWLYGYLTADRDRVKSAKFHVTLGDREETLTDDSFPFEFSLPLQADTESVGVKIEAVLPSGETVQANSVSLTR
jgi:hypothetical protein